MVSQVLTLYTTPVIYVYLDRFSLWANAKRRRFFARPAQTAGAAQGSL